MTTLYRKNSLDAELRPEYVEKAKAIERERPIYVGTTEDLRKMIGV